MTYASGQEGTTSVFHSDNPASDQPLQNISTLGSGSQMADEPFVQARTFPASTNEEINSDSTAQPKQDRVYVGQNYFGPGLEPGKTASVRVSTDDGKTFRLLGLEARSTGTAKQDGPSVRPAIATDGTVYVAFFHWTSESDVRTSQFSAHPESCQTGKCDPWRQCDRASHRPGR